MRDDLPVGALLTAIAAPVLTVCCGCGGVLLAEFVGTIGGWLTGSVVAAALLFYINVGRSAAVPGWIDKVLPPALLSS